MATGVLLTPPIVQFFNNLGLPAVNGSVLTQVSGVNAATYQDVALSTPLANPIPLNSRGEVSLTSGASSQCFLTPNTTYVFTLYDGPNATGNQLWQATYVNGVQIALTQSAIAAVLFPQTQAESNASVTPTVLNYLQGDPRRYGAKIDGATDDTVALQNWAKVGGYLTFPAGTSIINSAINIPLSGTTIAATRGATIQCNTGGISIFTLTGVSDVAISELHTKQTAATNTALIAHYFLNGATDCAIEHCKIEGINWGGVDFYNGSLRNKVKKCYFLTALNGNSTHYVQDTHSVGVFDSSNDNTVEDCDGIGTGDHGCIVQDRYNLPAKSCYRNKIKNNRFSGMHAYGIAVYQPGQASAGQISFTSPGTITAGSGYVNGYYAAVPLTGGAGSSATANISVIGGAVVSVFIVNPGSGYHAGDSLSASNANLGGAGSGFALAINLGSGIPLVNPGTIVGGSAYTNGQYNGVALTGGSGTGATANFTVAGGAITIVIPVNIGSGYQLGDVLSVAAANVGGTGSGFTLTLNQPVSADSTLNEVVGNTCKDIIGDSFYNANSGAGIYTVGVACGGTATDENTVVNCAVETTSGRTLPPGGIVFSGIYSGVEPISCDQNRISGMTQYECIDLVAILCGGSVNGNKCLTPAYNTTGSGIRIDGCQDITADGNIIEMLGTGSGVLIYANASNTSNCGVRGGRISTASGPAIQVAVNATGLTSSNVNLVAIPCTVGGNTSNGLSLSGISGGNVDGVQCANGNQVTLLAANCSNVKYSNLVLSRSSGTILAQFNGSGSTNAGSRLNRSCALTAAQVVNNGFGMICETEGTGAPGSGTQAQGDVSWNTAFTAGGVAIWVISAGGSPGTNKTISNT